MVTNYNETFKGGLGNSKQGYLKTSAYFMRKGLDEIPTAYIQNSPILNVQAITTPLLMMYNEDDENVSVGEGERLFVQMRSLKKKAWLIQYDHEKHTLSNTTNQLDFQNKVLGFFDYYLKNEPMPKWMNGAITPPID
jgi:dipeptidyl aminopeptidase/acylaminoacyl peptidase